MAFTLPDLPYAKHARAAHVGRRSVPSTSTTRLT